MLLFGLRSVATGCYVWCLVGACCFDFDLLRHPRLPATWSWSRSRGPVNLFSPSPARDPVRHDLIYRAERERSRRVHRSQRAQLRPDQHLPRRLQPDPGAAVRRRPRGRRPAAAAAGARCQKIGRFSLLVLMFLLLVLPTISPRADVVGRFVSPLVERIAEVCWGSSASRI